MTDKPLLILPEEPLLAQVEIKRDFDFYDMIINYSDIFSPGYIGYWAYGMRVDGTWLLYDSPDSEGSAPSLAEEKLARESFRAGETLPADWYALTVETVDLIVKAGVLQYGADFQDNYDATSLDVAIQLALLGEIVYG